MALEADETTEKRARWESFSFVIAAAGDSGVKVNVANHSYGEDGVADHTYTVTVDVGGPAECTCSAYEYHCDAGEACKHMVAVAETEPVLMAALECVAAGGRLTEPDVVTDGGRAVDAYCKALDCSRPATHSIVVNAPGRGYAEDPACAEHADEKRGKVYIRDVREGYDG